MRADRGNITRPSLNEVMDYRHHVDGHMVKLFNEIDQKTFDHILQIGLHHEQQHQELLLTDIKYILGTNPLFPAYKPGKSLVDASNEGTDWISMDEGVYEIGVDANAGNFSYDNESGQHKVYLNNYQINQGLISNGEYLEFMLDGGYTKHHLWLDEGWSWVLNEEITSPMYWHNIDGAWHYYTLGGLVKLDPNAILTHVSHYEAAAFAVWKGCRLPTEAEWEVASEHFQWGRRWEHTNSAYMAYPGYKAPSGALGEYNGKFMMNQMVLRGASVATSPDHSRTTYRNFFHPNMQWQFSGIRLVKNG